MKKIGIAIGVLVLVVAVGAWLLIANLGGIVKQVVENQGSKTTGTEVVLSSADVSLGEGRATLNGFSLGNPEGFKSDYAFRVGEVTVVLDTTTISQDPIVIKSVLIDSPSVIFEMAGGKSNFATIQENVAANTAAAGGAQPADAPDSQAAAGPKLVIQELTIQNGDMKVRAPFIDRDVGSSLPTIRLTGIGEKSSGVTAAEVTALLISELSKAATRTASNLDIEGLAGQLGDEMNRRIEEQLGGENGLGDRLKGIFGR